MSGNVVGWVFNHYPCSTAIDRTRKLILSEVAEAANRDFEEAHPGVKKIADHWGFDQGTVRRHLKALVEDGWLKITEEGGGRGKATVYQICRERGALRAGFEEVNARDSETIRAHSYDDTRAIPDSPHMSHPGTPLEPPAADEPPTLDSRARLIAQRVWETKRPRPAQPFMAITKIARAMLNAGHDDGRLFDAMMAVPTISTGWLEAKLNGRPSNGRASPSDTQRMIDEAFEFAEEEA